MVREDSALSDAFPGFVLLRLRGLDEPFQLRMARAASTDRRRFFAAADAITLLEMYSRDDRCMLGEFSSGVRAQKMLSGIKRSHDWHQVHDAQTFQGSDSKKTFMGFTLEALLLVLRKYGVHDSLLGTIAECRMRRCEQRG